MASSDEASRGFCTSVVVSATESGAIRTFPCYTATGRDRLTNRRVREVGASRVAGVDDMMHWWCRRRHSPVVNNLNLGASDHIIDTVSDVLDLVLTVQIALHSLISINKVFELFLEAVILIIQISHVFVERVDLSLQIHLILEHLITVLLQTVNFERDTLLILLELAESDLQLLASHAAVLAVAVFVLVGFEELSLSGLVLLVLIFKVAELAVQLVQRILELLTVGVRLRDFDVAVTDLFFSLAAQALHLTDTLIVVLEVSTENAASLVQAIDVLVNVVSDISKASQLTVVAVVDLFLITAQMLVVLDVLANSQVGRVDRADRVAEIGELIHGSEVVSLGDVNGFEQRDLLLLDGVVLSSQVVELPDEHVDLLAVVTDLGEAIALEALLVHLGVLDALLQVSDLISKHEKIALSVAKLVDLSLQLGNEVVLVLADLLDHMDLRAPVTTLNSGSNGHHMASLNLMVARLIHSNSSGDLATVLHRRSGARQALVHVSLMKGTAVLEGSTLSLDVGLMDEAAVRV